MNAYRLIKRLFNDWHKYEIHFEKAKGMNDHVQSRTNISISYFLFTDQLIEWKLKKNQLHFPNQIDFEESALALARLQQTYNLNVGQVASGILNGIKYGYDELIRKKLSLSNIMFS